MNVALVRATLLFRRPTPARQNERLAVWGLIIILLPVLAIGLSCVEPLSAGSACGPNFQISAP